MASTKKVVYAALFANFMIAVLKFGAYAITQSPSMLSEAFHSVSDTGNQILLLLGINLSEKGASEEHPFGRGKEQYFFAFVVAVLLFGVAGYASVREGWHAFTHPEEAHAPNVIVNYAVLVPALAFESYALLKAYKGIKKEMTEKEFNSMFKAYRNSKDATLITAFTEDTVACLGLIVAMVAIGLTKITHNPVYDAIGSLVIGFLLMGFAIVLAWENRGLIVGEGVTPGERENIINVIIGVDHVKGVDEVRTLHLGADTALVTANVHFDDSLTTDDIEDTVDKIEKKIREVVPAAKKIYIEAEGTEDEKSEKSEE